MQGGGGGNTEDAGRRVILSTGCVWGEHRGCGIRGGIVHCVCGGPTLRMREEG